MNFVKAKLEVNLNKIIQNYNFLRSYSSNKLIGASVKANSYGLGANEISKALSKCGCQHFFVAHIEEGINLRSHLKGDNIIFVLNGPLAKEELNSYLEYNLVPVLNNLWQIKLLNDFALQKQVMFSCALHLETGLNRLGLSEHELKSLINDRVKLAGLKVDYILSHLSSSDEKDEAYNNYQLGLFKKYTSFFPGSILSLASSSGIFLSSEYHFDLLRPGAALYGINPTPSLPNPMLNPVSLTAPIIHLQYLQEGESIGYNRTYKIKEKSVVATLPVGFADGYSRALSNCGLVYIDGIEANVIGRVSMDLMTVDVTHITPEQIFIGKEVEILGDNCTPDKLASISNTTGYEILTNLGHRFQRIFKDA